MVRLARQDEAKRTLYLISLAYAKAFFKLGPYKDIDSLIEFLTPFFKEKGNRLSYENILVYEKEQKLVGAICIYDGASSAKLDEKLNTFLHSPLEKECLEEFYYIDALAVDENFRRQGIAKALIDEAFKEAREAKKDLSLLVDQANTRAIQSYLKVGFKPFSHLFFNNAPYFRMVKYL